YGSQQAQACHSSMRSTYDGTSRGQTIREALQRTRDWVEESSFIQSPRLANRLGHQRIVFLQFRAHEGIEIVRSEIRFTAFGEIFLVVVDRVGAFVMAVRTQHAVVELSVDGVLISLTNRLVVVAERL